MNITPTWIRIQKDLGSFIFNKVKNRTIAEDLLHDVYLKAHARSNQLRDFDKINGWIYRIAQTTVADYYRTRDSSFPFIEDVSPPGNFNECLSECLVSMIKTLPEKYREVLEWTEFENASQLEVSGRLQLSYAGARSRVQRARKMLRMRIESLYFIQTDRYGNITACENRKNHLLNAAECINSHEMPSF